jgi:hypothetical protein
MKIFLLFSHQKRTGKTPGKTDKYLVDDRVSPPEKN